MNLLLQEKLGFIEQEKALQHMQHAFNDMLDALRNKESDKSLSAQRLLYLKERETTLNEFLQNDPGMKKNTVEIKTG